MRHLHLVSILLLVFAFISTPRLALAQDDEFAIFKSDDGRLTLSYPAEWIIKGDGYWFGPFIVVGTTEHTMNQLMSTDEVVLESGDVLLVLMLGPTDLFGMGPDSGTSLADLTRELATGLRNQGDSEQAQNLGEAEEFVFEGDITIGYMTLDDESIPNALIVRYLNDTVLAVSLILAPQEEFSEELADLGRQVVASVTYTGTAEEMLAGPVIEDAPEGVTAADLDGEALVAERCTVCHTDSRIKNTHESEVGWTAIVNQMISAGADLNRAEREAVITYLAKNYP